MNNNKLRYNLKPGCRLNLRTRLTKAHRINKSRVINITVCLGTHIILLNHNVACSRILRLNNLIFQELNIMINVVFEILNYVYDITPLTMQ